MIRQTINQIIVRFNNKQALVYTLNERLETSVYNLAPPLLSTNC